MLQRKAPVEVTAPHKAAGTISKVVARLGAILIVALLISILVQNLPRLTSAIVARTGATVTPAPKPPVIPTVNLRCGSGMREDLLNLGKIPGATIIVPAATRATDGAHQPCISEWFFLPAGLSAMQTHPSAPIIWRFDKSEGQGNFDPKALADVPKPLESGPPHVPRMLRIENDQPVDVIVRMNDFKYR